MGYKLTYFNMRAAAEPIRFLLAYSEIEYEDNRIDHGQWAVLKPNTSFGKVPILEIDGKTINQTAAICRFLAKNASLVGNDDWESLLVDIAVDNMRDVQQALITYYIAEESTKAKLLETITNETLPFYMSKLEDIVITNNGYFVNGKLTWADIYFAAAIDSVSEAAKINVMEGFPRLQELKNKVFDIPQIKSWVETRPDTEV